MLIDKNELKKLVIKFSNKNDLSIQITEDMDLFLDLQYTDFKLLQLLAAIENTYKINLNTCSVTRDFPLLFSHLVTLIETSDIKSNNDRVHEIKKYSRNKVDFYKDSPEKLDDLIITPSEIYKNNTTILSEDYLVSFLSGDLLHYNSINAVGEVVTNTISRLEKAIMEKNICKLRKQWYGINLEDRLLKFHAYVYQGNKLCEDKKIINEENTLSIDLKDVTQDKIVNLFAELQAFTPIWISINPSVMYIIVDFMKKKNVKIYDVKYIELFGESDLELLEDEIHLTFPNAQIARIVQTHLGAVALEDPNHKVRIITENVSLDEKQKKIIVSNKQILSSPVINFCSDIKGTLSIDREEMEFTRERIANLVILPEEGFASPRIFEKFILKVNEEFNNPIVRFQIVQNCINLFELFIEIKNSFYGWEAAIAESFLKNINQIVDRTYWNINFIKDLSNCEYSGIYSYFYNNI